MYVVLLKFDLEKYLFVFDISFTGQVIIYIQQRTEYVDKNKQNDGRYKSCGR